MPAILPPRFSQAKAPGFIFKEAKTMKSIFIWAITWAGIWAWFLAGLNHIFE